jgi:nucleotide-binding universal stress UspA family protein
MFKTIVVGLDGRAGGHDALRLAARLARAGATEIVAVRAFPYEPYASRFGPPIAPTIATEQCLHELDRELEGWQSVVARRLAIGDSSPARALHRVAEEQHADLIVVGSTHHGPVGRVLIGDDAQATLHASPCPVAIAPRGAATTLPDRGRLHRIGVGYDGGEEAAQALRLAAALAHANGASLHALWVVTIPPTLGGAPLYDDSWMEVPLKDSVRRVQEAVAKLDGVRASGEAVLGDPVSELAKLSMTVDLLVAGSRAWGPVRRLFMGSTAARLAREAHCPLLVLPRGAATGQPGEREPAQLLAV